MSSYYVTLSHLRSKGKAIAYKWYCTGSGMLMRYTHQYQCIYLVKTFHKSVKSFDATDKTAAVYKAHHVDIDYGC